MILTNTIQCTLVEIESYIHSERNMTCLKCDIIYYFQEFIEYCVSFVFELQNVC